MRTIDHSQSFDLRTVKQVIIYNFLNWFKVSVYEVNQNDPPKTQDKVLQ